MIYLFLLDILIYNVTPYNIPLFLILLPNQRNLKVPLIIILILSFFEYRFLLFLIIIYLIFFINKVLNKHFIDNNKLYYIELILDYFLFFTLTNLFKFFIP